MDASGVGSLSPTAISIAALLFSLVLFTVVKLGWGMAQWSKKSEHRVGERWGGEHVDVVEWTGTEGYVRAGGELWRARSSDELVPGERVKVVRMDGLMLEVSKGRPRPPKRRAAMQGD